MNVDFIPSLSVLSVFFVVAMVLRLVEAHGRHHVQARTLQAIDAWERTADPQAPVPSPNP